MIKNSEGRRTHSTQAVGLGQKHAVFPPCVIWGEPYIHAYHRNDCCLPSSSIWSVSVARLFCWFVCFLSGCGQGLEDGTQMLPGPALQRIPVPRCGQAAYERASASLRVHLPYPWFEIMLQQSSQSYMVHNFLHSTSEKVVGLGVYVCLDVTKRNKWEETQIYSLSQKSGQGLSNEIETVMLSVFPCCFMASSCVFNLCTWWLQTLQHPA